MSGCMLWQMVVLHPAMANPRVAGISSQQDVAGCNDTVCTVQSCAKVVHAHGAMLASCTVKKQETQRSCTK